MKISILSTLTLIATLSFLGTSYAQIQRDKSNKFSIWIPEKWSKNVYYDGSDKVFDYLSPDETAAIQLRVFDADPAVTADLIVEVYEKSMFPEGTYRETLRNYTSSTGIPGLQGVYQYYYEGVKIAQSNFYTVQNGKGYIVSAIIPESKLAQKSKEVKSITKTFNIDGVGSSSSTFQHGSFDSSTTKSFNIDKITLTDKIDDNNNALDSKSTFNTTTPEIFAVIEYTGYTTEDLTIAWIYNNNDMTITEDIYNFTDNGGIGVASLTKPNLNWPAGSYTIILSMSGKTIKKMNFSIYSEDNTMMSFSEISGKYIFEGRSDGKQMVNYHYIKINKDGSFYEEYQPKNSGEYKSKKTGTWKKTGDKLILLSNGIKEIYTINGDKLTRTSDRGIVFTFRKS